MSDKNRTGVLKDGDRNYLGLSKDDHKASDSKWYTGKGRLRTSIIKGITDFISIQQELDNWNWPKLIDEIRGDEHDVRKGITSAIAFFYEIHETMGWDFEKTLWNALEDTYTHGVAERNMQNLTVDGVDFDAQLIEPDDIKTMNARVEQKLENDKPLTESEIAWIAKNAPQLLEQWRNRERRDSYLARTDRALRKHDTESNDG
ncbi:MULTISPECIES: hypothetical protein [Halobacterium]|uniref:hypothetical protein n=1 Tax=Halobacterium TaxID=2239 RepID=UPI001E57E8CE|nr:MULTISPECIES: hypothetical protein [Halobacterium]MDL0123636.1 hypothetical protein [Halobacterium salinarum]UDF60552.1 hypothetical protein JRZ79_13355 [Halobacterium sp. BOL4-2]